MFWHYRSTRKNHDFKLRPQTSRNKLLSFLNVTSVNKILFRLKLSVNLASILSSVPTKLFEPLPRALTICDTCPGFFFSHFTGTTEIFCTTCLDYQCQAFTREINRYFVNDTTQSHSCFHCEKSTSTIWHQNFHRNFRTNGKRSIPTYFTFLDFKHCMDGKNHLT